MVILEDDYKGFNLKLRQTISGGFEGVISGENLYKPEVRVPIINTDVKKRPVVFLEFLKKRVDQILNGEHPGVLAT